MKERKIPEGVEVVVGNLEVPWSLDFSPEGYLYLTERVGKVSRIIDGDVEPLLRIDAAANPGDESGLLGLALDPEFRRTRLVYIYYTYRGPERVWNRVSHFREENDKLVDEKVILDKIPGGRVHDGGRIKFGPDGKLYITTGETWRRELAQRLDFLGGKILRVNSDGSLPSDNPFPDSPVYSYGNRNPQGLAWHPATGALYETEHGPSGENGWYAHDEVNIIEPGKNYGWPYVIGDSADPRFTNPVYHTGDVTWAPSGAAFYSGSRYPQWRNYLFVANLRGRHLRAMSFKPPDYREVDSSFAFFEEELGRLRDAVQGPEGYLYFCTNNRDGRGESRKGDDYILRIATMER